MTIHIQGIREIIENYDACFLDIFGLLHDGIALYPGTLDCLTQMKAIGKTICLVSNTPRRAAQSAADLKRHGITAAHYDHIVTAGESAHHALRDRYQERKVYFLGTPEFTGALGGLDIEMVDDIADADFILNAIPGEMGRNGEKLQSVLEQGARRKLPMVCANPDLVVHIGDRLLTCAGTYAALYEALGGAVEYHGKPYGGIYDLAYDLIGRPGKNRLCGMGDALATDIKGASGFGIDSVWCLSGIHWEELRYAHDPGFPDPERVTTAVAASPYKPAATITQFRW